MSPVDVDSFDDSFTADAGESLRRSERALRGIYEISKILTSPARIEVTLSNVVSVLNTYFELQNGLVVLFGENDEPRIAVGSVWNEAATKHQVENLPAHLIEQVIADRTPVIISKSESGFDPAESDGSGDCLSEACSLIGIPIMDRDRVIGTLMAESCHSDPSSQIMAEESNFLAMVANLVGQTVRLQTLVSRDRERLMNEQRRTEKEFETQVVPKREQRIAGIVGESSTVQATLGKIRIVARSHLPVLLRGESGTGKELFAQAVHDLSPRRKGPLVKVNCAALPESMLESELFGHEKGAFTGALAQRKGRFELADGGTLFLDEIGEISPSFQAKLLRILQEGEFQRVGGTDTIKVDVRIVAATNRNLEEAVSNGDFRADLYFRISVVPVLLAPLRDRREDIPLLAKEFLRRYNEAHESAIEFADDGMELLCNCEFPGNIRELESCVRRTAAFASGPRIVAADFACQNDSCLSSLLWKSKTDCHRPSEGWNPLPIADHRFADSRHPRPPIHLTVRPSESNDTNAARGERASSDDSAFSPADSTPEKTRLIEAMERAGWVQAKAARLLGLSSRQMGYALRKHGIEIKRF